MSEISKIPVFDLICMLDEAVFYFPGDEDYQEGFSLDVSEETKYTDLLRGEKLYPSREEAIIAHWKRHFEGGGS